MIVGLGGPGGRIVHHSIKDDFGRLLTLALGDVPVYVAHGPIYENDPASELLQPFIRSAREAGLNPDELSDEQLAPELFLQRACELRMSWVDSWAEEALPADWEKLEDWARAGLVLEIARRRGVSFKDGTKAHVRWKLRGTVTGRFGVEPGGFNPLVIPKEMRSRIVPSGPGRSIVVFDFRAMDLCSMISVTPGLAERYAGTHDLHGRTAEIMGLDRDIAKREIFVYAYGGASSYTSDFVVQLPEIKFIRGGSRLEAGANARLIQRISADAFKAALSRALPLLTSDDCLPLFTVHDEVVLDVLNERLDGLWSVTKALQDGASERIGVPYTVGMKVGSSYAEAKG